MQVHTIHSHTFPLSPPLLTLPFLSQTTLSRGTSAIPIHTYRRPLCLLRNRDSNLKVVRCSMRDERVVEPRDAALLVETCITRTLPPALTLEHGLNKIAEALEELKSKPTPCSSGMYRFQVAVPPKVKALNWFCCQPESSGVFPQFFLSKEVENPTFKSLFLNRTRGIFGIGAALYVKGSYTSDLVECGASRRYLTVESTFVMAYGFIDMNFDSVSSSVMHEIGSFYLFIPQVELKEFGDISVLAATIAWSDFSLGTLEKALQNCELSLYQARQHFLSIHNKSIISALRKFSVVEDKSSQMAYMSAFSLGGRDLSTDAMELVSSLS